MQEMKDDIKHLSEGLDDIKATLDKFIQNADRKYAPMWAASAWRWLILSVGGAIIVLATAYIKYKAGI